MNAAEIAGLSRAVAIRRLADRIGFRDDEAENGYTDPGAMSYCERIGAAIDDGVDMSAVGVEAARLLAEMLPRTRIEAGFA